MMRRSSRASVHFVTHIRFFANTGHGHGLGMFCTSLWDVSKSRPGTPGTRLVASGVPYRTETGERAGNPQTRQRDSDSSFASVERCKITVG